MASLSPSPRLTSLTANKRAPLWIRIGFSVCIFIAVAVVLRRIVALLWPNPSLPSQVAALDAVFASYAALTLAHIIPAMIFVLVAPFVFLRRFANVSWPRHLFYPLGFIVVATAYLMSRHAVGGWLERSAVLFFNSLFLFTLTRAFLSYRRGDLAAERPWLLRAVGIVLGIATTRPVMGVFFATSPLTHLGPQQFFGIAFWIGFSINTLAVELWLRSGEKSSAAMGFPSSARGLS